MVGISRGRDTEGKGIGARERILWDGYPRR